jgi:hypothetical protein
MPLYIDIRRRFEKMPQKTFGVQFIDGILKYASKGF